MQGDTRTQLAATAQANRLFAILTKAQAGIEARGRGYGGGASFRPEDLPEEDLDVLISLYKLYEERQSQS